MLHKILEGTGFVILLLGAAGMDSEKVLIPIAMISVGMGLLLWAAYEEGYFRKGGKCE